MFRQYFDRKKSKQRVEKLTKLCDFGTDLRAQAIVTHRQFWAKTPYTSEDDIHESGFIQGYASREEEVLKLKSELEYLRTLTKDIERSNSIQFIKE